MLSRALLRSVVSVAPRATAASFSTLAVPFASSGSSSGRSWSSLMAGAAAALLASTATLVSCDDDGLKAMADAGAVRSDLPDITLKDVAAHKSAADGGIWVTFKDGVYDITDFVSNHPGGEKILMAAGGAVDPFWRLYAVHKESEEAAELLAGMRIGNVSAEDREARKRAPVVDASDPFSGDPIRHPALKVNSAKPFNAEVPPELLTENFITPSELHFVRNHLPVPRVDAKDYKLTVTGVGADGITLTLDQLKRFKKHSITAVVQCGGNRRSELNGARKVKGLGWTGGAISNAEWAGARLRDVLLAAGVGQSQWEAVHVQFEGLDTDESGVPYGASIPIAKAMSFDGDVLLAYEMNGEEVPLDHGYPVRLVVPGHVGSRNVKWVSKIHLSKDESPSFWQQKDYKFLSPSVAWEDAGKAMAATPSIQEMPVQSSILSPTPGSKVEVSGGKIPVSGYAYSGGGRRIMRVEVSVDGGETWTVADLEQADQPAHQSWAWTLWDAFVPVPTGEDGKPVKDVEIVAKAVDYSLNTQPEKLTSIWNLRGLACNAWPRVSIKVDSP